MDSHNSLESYYPGEFDIAGRKLHGNLVINNNNTTIHLYIQRKTEMVDGIHLGYVDKIVGTLTMGQSVILLNNECIHDTVHMFSHQDIIYEAEYAILGNTLECYDGIRCIVENGLKWLGDSQIDAEDFITIKLKNVEEKVFSWFGAKVTFSTALKNDLWSVPRREECKVIERLVLSIDFLEKKDVSEIIEIRDKILSLISFAIKDNVNIAAQYVMNSDDYYEQENYKTLNEYELISLKQKNNIYNRHPIEYNFTVDQLPATNDLAETIEKLIPVMDLYLTLYRYPNMPIEMIFLNLIQAVETLHSRFYYNNDKNVYVKSVYDRFSTYAAFERIKELLLSNNQESDKCRQIYLVSRVNDLLIDDFGGPFMSLYMESNYAQKIVNTRNYYTHYDEKNKNKALSGKELLDAIFVLRLLLEKYICRIMGIDIKDRIATQLRNARRIIENPED